MGFWRRVFTREESPDRATFDRPPPSVKFGFEAPPELTGLLQAESVDRRISRREALQVPAVLRSRNLICGTLSTLPVLYLDPGRNVVERPLLDQPDPDLPNAVSWAMVYEDLFFESVAWWRALAFDAAGYPTAARHVPPEAVHVAGSPSLPSQAQITPDQYFPIDGQVFIDGIPVPDREIIRFDSPNPPFLIHAARAIRTCLRLDTAAALYAKDPVPLGYFTPQEGADPLSAEPGSAPDGSDRSEVEMYLDQYEEARKKRAWGYLGGMKAETLQWNPEQLQLAAQRDHAVLEIARAAGIDPEDLAVSTTSRTYQNGVQRRLDLTDFTLGAYASGVQDRLSMRDVAQRGHKARIDFGGFQRSDELTRMQTYEVGLRVGAYTQDEIRERENRPTIRRPAAPAAAERPRLRPVSAMTDRETVNFAEEDRGNIDTPDAADLNAAARRYCAKRGWAMSDGSYPIRPADMHGVSDLQKAIRAVGRGSSSHDEIRNHIKKRARGIGEAERIPDDWTAGGGMSAESAQITFAGDEIAASFRVNEAKRTVSGLLVPWDQVAMSGGRKWSFRPGSLHWSSDTRVKMNVDHERGQTVGRGVRLQNIPQGLDGSFQVARGVEGDRALTFAEDGVFDGFSVEIEFSGDDDGFEEDRSTGVNDVYSATLRAVALTAMPAFDDARVTRVAASRDKDGRVMPETKNAGGSGTAQATEAPVVDAAVFTDAMKGVATQIADSHQALTEGLTESLGASFTAAMKAALEDIHNPQDGPEPVRAARFTVTREAPIYSFDGRGSSLVRDAWYAQREHDTEAQERLRRFHAQTNEVQALVASHVAFAADRQLNFATVTTGTASEVIPPGYRPDLFVPQLAQDRPLVNALSRGTIANATPFVVPVFASLAGAPGDHTEGNTPSEATLDLGTKTVTPGAISGKLPLTREIVDSSNPAIDQIALAAMRENYSQQTEAKVNTLLQGANGAGGTIDVNGFVPSGAQAATVVATTGSEENLVYALRSALAKYPFRRFGAPTMALMGQNPTTLLANAKDTTGRPLLPSMGAQNSSGLGNAVTQGWFIDGLAHVPAWAMTGTAAGDTQVITLNRSDVWAWESPTLAFRFEEKSGPQIIELALFGYFAAHVLRPVGLSGMRVTTV